MKLKHIAILTLVIIHSSCFRNHIETSNDQEFKTNHASIQNDMTMDEVRSFLGEPMNRQFLENQETWQWCEANTTSREYFTVSFVDKKVTGINTYGYGNNRIKACYNCEDCFKEIRFRASRSKSIGVTQEIEKTFISAVDLSTQLDENGSVVLAYYKSGFDRIDVFENEKFVEQIVKEINEKPENSYALVGHTNSQGAAETNLTLSENRAKKAHEFLVRKYGLDVSKIQAFGEGETNPKGSNDTREGRSMNSRLELRMLIK